MRRGKKAYLLLAIGIMLVMVISSILSAKSIAQNEDNEEIDQEIKIPIYPENTDIPEATQEPTKILEPVKEQEQRLAAINYEYPYNQMSVGFGMEDTEGFAYYKMPKEYEREGGCLPEMVQIYTFCLSRKYDVSYPLVIALIETESAYKYDAEGDDGKSKGYMQIYQKFHEERMEKVGCGDLMNPYGNILVGIDYLSELQEKYEDERLVLMFYNRGGHNEKGTGALDLWEAGIYETEYSVKVLERALEIEKELEVAEK